ncbi:pathogenesis-related protein 1C-like [Telopea speciosissima]|uniref:pathogenesis-related protein 1C-like n=1 Tax=Telopea speciosissima TaxID=54955 RepID=UPI001CC6F9D7|nr:pathogenesis-related protein 1C-like [Telopea speciosissima]
MALLLRLLLIITSLVIMITTSGAKMTDSSRVFTIINNCTETIWPGIFPGENFGGGGFELKSGQSIVFTAPVGWSGRIWGRTNCNFDENGNGTCQTGSCGTTLKCKAPGKPPASLAEFTLALPDFYDVSLADGFNLPVTVTPINGTGNCSIAYDDPSSTIFTCSASNYIITYCSSRKQLPEQKISQETLTTTYIHKKKKVCKCQNSNLICTKKHLSEDSEQKISQEGITTYNHKKKKVCKCYGNNLICSGKSEGSKSFAGRWWTIIFSFMVIINL